MAREVSDTVRDRRVHVFGDTVDEVEGDAVGDVVGESFGDTVGEELRAVVVSCEQI